MILWKTDHVQIFPSLFFKALCAFLRFLNLCFFIFSLLFLKTESKCNVACASSTSFSRLEVCGYSITDPCGFWITFKMLDVMGCGVNTGLSIPMPGMKFPLGLYESDMSLVLILLIQVPRLKALNILF